MKTIQHSIDIEAPAAEVYRAWNDFEGYPRFMERVAEVRCLDEQRQHWTAEIQGHRVEWETQITVRIPNRRIAWRVIGGDSASGAVTMDGSGPHTHLTLQFTYTAEAPWAAMEEEEIRRSVRTDLEQFKLLFEGPKTLS